MFRMMERMAWRLHLHARSALCGFVATTGHCTTTALLSPLDACGRCCYSRESSDALQHTDFLTHTHAVRRGPLFQYCVLNFRLFFTSLSLLHHVTERDDLPLFSSVFLRSVCVSDASSLCLLHVRGCVVLQQAERQACQQHVHCARAR